MTGRSTWRRWLSGILAAVLGVLLLAAPAATVAACPDDGAAVTAALDEGIAIAELEGTAADGCPDGCPDGCATCFCCQWHHVTAAIPSALSTSVVRFHLLERHAATTELVRRSDHAYRLKRPPRT